MDTVPGLKQIQTRKRELLLASELNRQVLRVEAGQLLFRVEQFKRGYGWAHRVWKWAAPLAGFLLARRFKRGAGVFAKGSLLVTALGTLWKVWETRQQKPRDPAQDGKS